MSKAAELAALIGSQTALSNRNLIINGAMQVAQRGTSSANSGIQTVDRFGMGGAWTQLTFTQEQSSDAPDGFANSYKVTTTTAETAIDAGDLLYINQATEAQNLQHLKYGTSGAKTCTLSFWVKSSITGVFGISLYQADGNYILTPTYTINVANTWEYKTISISGNTLGAPANDNGDGIRVSFILAAGTDYNDGTSRTSWESYSSAKFGSGHVQNGVMTTLNATFQITGVQLELGEQATPFEHRSFGDELQRCQRYYRIFPSLDSTATYGTIGNGYAYDTNTFLLAIPLSVRMRSLPSVTSSGSLKVFTSGNPTNAITNVNTSDSSRTSLDVLYVDSDVGAATLIAREGGMVTRNNDSDAYMAFDSEL